jgi:DNA polymerase-3 subunit epsilon
MRARNEAIGFAKTWLHDQSCLIIDTETTGLGNYDEIIQIGIINMQGEVILDTYVKPRKRSIDPKAEEKHGISMAMFKGAPKMEKLHPELVKILDRKTVIAYNSDYNQRLLNQSISRVGIAPPGMVIGWRLAVRDDQLR